MNSHYKNIRQTRFLRHVVVPRYIAGASLGIFGSLHLLLASFSMMPIMEAANLPLVGFSAIVVPILEVIAGMMLVSGFFARIGAAITLPIMAMAIYAHVVATWPGEMPFILPLVVICSAAYVLWLGAGAWSFDLRAFPEAQDHEHKVITVPFPHEAA